MDRGAWWATVHGVAKSWTQLSVKNLPTMQETWVRSLGQEEPLGLGVEKEVRELFQGSEAQN